MSNRPLDGSLTPIRYSRLMRPLLLASPLAFVAIAFFLIRSALDATRLPFVILILLAALFLHLAWVAARGLQFHSVEIRVLDQGLEIQRGKRKDFVSWGEIGRVRWHPVLQYLTVRGRDGTLLLLVDYWISGFRRLNLSLRKWSRGELTCSAT